MYLVMFYEFWLVWILEKSLGGIGVYIKDMLRQYNKRVGE
jgi:hypothetical protein